MWTPAHLGLCLSLLVGAAAGCRVSPDYSMPIPPGEEHGFGESEASGATPVRRSALGTGPRVAFVRDGCIWLRSLVTGEEEEWLAAVPRETQAVFDATEEWTAPTCMADGSVAVLRQKRIWLVRPTCLGAGESVGGLEGAVLALGRAPGADALLALVLTASARGADVSVAQLYLLSPGQLPVALLNSPVWVGPEQAARRVRADPDLRMALVPKGAQDAQALYQLVSIPEAENLTAALNEREPRMFYYAAGRGVDLAGGYLYAAMTAVGQGDLNPRNGVYRCDLSDDSAPWQLVFRVASTNVAGVAGSHDHRIVVACAARGAGAENWLAAQRDGQEWEWLCEGSDPDLWQGGSPAGE